jgi:hypothetical protein
MAPPRRKREKPSERRFYKVSLPEDIAKRIETKAKAEGRPQNRIIINELARIPYLEQFDNLAMQVSEMKIVLARYASQQISHDISKQLLDAVDAVLKAEGGTLPAAIEKLRLVRDGMLARERAAKRAGQEPDK